MDPMSTMNVETKEGNQEFEIVDAQAREEIAQAQEDIETLEREMTSALKPINLYGMQDGRASSANIAATGSNSLQYLIATSTMTEGKPPIGDSKILHMEWDNTGGWTTQTAFGHSGKRTAANAMALRSMSRGTWGDWQTLLDLLYPIGSVYISNTNTNPSESLGGTWSLIHKRLAYKVVEDPVTFNTTNTQNGDSVAVLNGEVINLRLTFAPKVELNDNTIEIGQLNLDSIGLTGKYGEYASYINDGAGGMALLYVSNTGVIQTQEVINKTGTGTMAATTSTGQARLTLMFAQTSMVDSFCDEFHWVRTA